MVEIIGLTGLKRSGKDATAQCLVDEHGYARVAFADPVKRILADLDPYVCLPPEVHSVSQMYMEIGTLERRIVTAFRQHAVAAMPNSHVTMAIRRLDPLLAGAMRLSDALEDAGGDWDRLKEGSEDASQQVVTEIRRLQQMLGTEVARNMISQTIWVDTAMQLVKQLRQSGTPVVISDIRFDNEAQAVRVAGGVVVEIYRPSLEDRATDGHASEHGVASELIDHTIVNDGTLEDLHQEVDQLIETVPV